MQNTLILLATVAAAGLLFHPRVANARLWRATVTPLASIIGSGFLVLGPVLGASYGLYAPLVMLGLCTLAYLFGAAIRANIATIDTDAPRPDIETRIETVSSWVLAFAYIISVAYYLNLFGAFGVSLTAVDDGFHARLLTSAVFALILIVGLGRGFSALERMEQVSVGIKLAVIAGLLIGLAIHFADTAAHGALLANPPTVSAWGGLTLAFGLIVTVQGFETSRYLGDSYDAPMRIRSMRLAQALSAAIYMAYICLLAYAFVPGAVVIEETAIIDMMEIVAPILPILLVAAALSAQFSAAIADTSGSGGLITELTRGRISTRQGYGLLVAIGLALTWTANIFEIISHASRAFAIYYALQAAIAALAAHRNRDHTRTALFTGAFLLAVAIALLGRSVE